MILTKNYLERLTSKDIIGLAEFIVTENFNHHADNVYPIDYKEDIESIYKEELNYFDNAMAFAVRDHLGDILGAIRVLKWNYTDVLPIQKIFGINPLLITGHSPLKSIWHIGRFAIKQKVRDISLFKQLMVCAIAPICQNENSVAFAECDSKLLRVLKLLGIQATVIGDAVDYLGSETIPICMTYDGLIDFYNTNKDLVPLSISNQSSKNQLLHKSVISNPISHNYSLV